MRPEKMMTQRYPFFAALALFAMAATAHGAENWSGPSAYLTGGLGMGDATAKMATTYTSTGYFARSSVQSVNGVGQQDFSDDGFATGLGGAYNFQFGSLVLGLAADINFEPLYSGNQVTNTYPDYAPYTYTVKQSVASDGFLSLRPVLGYSFGRFLIYGTAGLAVSKIRYQGTFTDNYNGATASESKDMDETATTWIAGGGLKYRIAQHWALSAEYLNAAFGGFSGYSDNFTEDGTAYPGTNFNHSFALSIQTARLGLEYRF
jgi:opacity protein-like surface antigen